MRIEIQDVGHGGCIPITGPFGHVLMLDCGYSSDRPWFPSVAYWSRTINTLLLMNLDEDHVEDFYDLCRMTRINAVVSNPTITARALKAMKPDGMRRGVQATHDFLAYYGRSSVGDWAHPLGGVRWHAFWNAYGFDFTNTNNLSLAVFVSFGGFTVLFGGDLESAGWKKLLENPYFRARLPEVKVYVASHHGRDNGCCEQLFQFMKPDAIVFSDGPKKFGTQDTTDWYGNRASGVISSGWPWAPRSELRKVFTTRNDGTVTIHVNACGNYTIATSRAKPDIPGISRTALPTISGLSAGLLE